jgi:hypothetical protein
LRSESVIGGWDVGLGFENKVILPVQGEIRKPFLNPGCVYGRPEIPFFLRLLFLFGKIKKPKKERFFQEGVIKD